MSKFIPYALIAVLLLSSLPSCRKVYDYIREHPDAHDTLCRVTVLNMQPYSFNFSYDAKGNPISILNVNRFGTSPVPDNYFRYDRFGRLSDRMGAYVGNFGAIAWHKYAYPRPDLITDTSMFYTGDIREPAPLAKDAWDGYSITGYSLDAHDRIVKVWSIPNDPPHTPVLQSIMNYDTNGNLPLPSPDLSYDDKVNVYRTNKVWQFLNNDYSRNNVVKIDYFFFTNYNAFGLPLNMRNLQSYNIYTFGYRNEGPEADITYACSAPKGPIDY